MTSVIGAVLFDLDGVIRHFSPDHAAGIEARHGLPRGALEAVAFSQPILTEVTTGAISRRDWVRRIGAEVGDDAAADEWGAKPSTIDHDVLDLADELRGIGMVTAVLTNGTDTIAAETEAAGLTARFDRIFNSADIGFIKPDVRAFSYVLNALDLAGSSVFFTDDSPSKLTGAAEVGMRTHHFVGVAPLRGGLRAAGVPVRAGS